MSGYLQRRRHQKKIERIKREVAPRIDLDDETIRAQVLVFTAAREVVNGHVRSDAQLLQDFACEGDVDRVAELLRSHEEALLFLVLRYPSDPMTPEVEVQLERNIAILRQLVAAGGST